ncbi:MAG: hypothetical protein HZB34_03635 [Nitrospirae bacterium]|nr:hypothetical protein [Nitrospirota bacterium]
MKRMCECGRPVHLKFQDRLPRHGAERPRDHTLCQQCYRRMRNQVLAARKMPKPWWAGQVTGADGQLLRI